VHCAATTGNSPAAFPTAAFSTTLLPEDHVVNPSRPDAGIITGDYDVD
jgi:hypothetical protein